MCILKGCFILLFASRQKAPIIECTFQLMQRPNCYCFFFKTRECSQISARLASYDLGKIRLKLLQSIFDLTDGWNKDPNQWRHMCPFRPKLRLSSLDLMHWRNKYHSQWMTRIYALLVQDKILSLRNDTLKWLYNQIGINLLFSNMIQL